MITTRIPPDVLAKEREHGDKIEASHRNRGDQTARFKNRKAPYSEDVMGWYGQVAFNLLTTLALDRSIRKTDYGIDFVVPVTNETIDLKTNFRMYERFDLLVKNTDVERGHIPKYYVRAEMPNKDTVIFHGWTGTSNLTKWPRKPSTIPEVAFNYVKPLGELLPMEVFAEYIAYHVKQNR